MTAPGRIVVTGCSSGIGRSLALGLAGAGRPVTATVRRPEDAADLAAAGVEVVLLDLAEPGAVERFAADLAARHGDGIAGLVNNAAYAQSGAVEDLPQDLAERQFRVNCLAPMRLAGLLAPGMARRGRGVIINLGSSAAGTGQPYTGAYVASKAALESYSESMRHEMRPFNVWVCLVIPGPVRTSINRNSRSASRGSFPAAESRHAAVYQVIHGDEHSLHEGIFRFFTTGPEPVVRTVLRILDHPRPGFRHYPTLFPLAMRWARLLFPQRLYDLAVDFLLTPYRRGSKRP